MIHISLLLSLSIRPITCGGLDIFSDSDGGGAGLNIKTWRADIVLSLLLTRSNSGHGDIHFKRDGGQIDLL